MKFISLILLFVLMHWTWAMVNTPRAVTQDIHIGIQEDLKSMITSYIQENLPNSRNLKFERFWTEKTKEKQIKASFIYSFEDESAAIGAARVAIEGYAMLNRKADEDGKTQVWSMDDLYILNNKVEFKDGMKITPDGEEPDVTASSDEDAIIVEEGAPPVDNLPAKKAAPEAK